MVSQLAAKVTKLFTIGNKMQILALCGYPKSGKDTIAQMLVTEYGFERLAFADPMRDSLYSLNPWVLYNEQFWRLAKLIDEVGWDEAKTSIEVRELLQKMGSECGRDIHGKDCWVKILEKKMLANDKPKVITDLRFANEAAMLDRHLAFVMHISRPGHGPVNNHSSEKLDYTRVSHGCVNNNGNINNLLETFRAFTNDFVNGKFTVTPVESSGK